MKEIIEVQKFLKVRKYSFRGYQGQDRSNYYPIIASYPRSAENSVTASRAKSPVLRNTELPMNETHVTFHEVTRTEDRAREFFKWHRKTFMPSQNNNRGLNLLGRSQIEVQFSCIEKFLRTMAAFTTELQLSFVPIKQVHYKLDLAGKLSQHIFPDQLSGKTRFHGITSWKGSFVVTLYFPL